MKLKKHRFKKYKANLHYKTHHEDGSNDGRTIVYSYNTMVAVQDGDQLCQQGWWSVTTQKHINYAASQLGLKLNRQGF